MDVAGTPRRQGHLQRRRAGRRDLGTVATARLGERRPPLPQARPQRAVQNLPQQLHAGARRPQPLPQQLNRDGTLYTLAFANPCAFHVDPVEKKPLFHFLPGTQSLFPRHLRLRFPLPELPELGDFPEEPEETKDPRGPELRLRPPVPRAFRSKNARLSLFPEDVVALAEAIGCPPSPTPTPSRLRFTNTPTTPASRPRAQDEEHPCHLRLDRGPPPATWINRDAAHVDLKGFDEDIYQKLNTGKLQPVLNTLKTLKELGVWFEVINLVVPTYTDNPDMIRRMSDWLVNWAPISAPFLPVPPPTQTHPSRRRRWRFCWRRRRRPRRPAVRLRRQRPRPPTRKPPSARLQTRRHRARHFRRHPRWTSRTANAVFAGRRLLGCGKRKVCPSRFYRENRSVSNRDLRSEHLLLGSQPFPFDNCPFVTYRSVGLWSNMARQPAGDECSRVG